MSNRIGPVGSSTPEGVTSAYRLRIERWEELPRAIAEMQVAGAGFRVPLLQGLYRGEIAYLEVARGASSGRVKKFINVVTRPAVLVLGDDDDMSSGPGGFPPAERALRWAHQVIVHGAMGREEDYRAIVLAAQIVGRLVLVETPSARLPEWTAAARKWATNAVIQSVTPPPGQQHPCPRSRETLQ